MRLNLFNYIIIEDFFEPFRDFKKFIKQKWSRK